MIGSASSSGVGGDASFCCIPVAGGARARLAPAAAWTPASGLARPGPDRGGLRDHRGRAGLAAELTGRGDLLTRVEAGPSRAAAGTAVDPVMLKLNNLFMSVAEQMGVRLQATAHSVNVKERLDFSSRCSTPTAG